VSQVPEYLLAVWEAAKQKPLPAVASGYYLPGMKKLIGLCAELQLAARERTFFLACRDAGALVGANHRRVWKWLKRLEIDRVLVRISTGSKSTRKANEYRYHGGPHP
jgi:hypothetical protein